MHSSLLLVVILVVGLALLFKARHSGFAFALLAVFGAAFAWSLFAVRSTVHVAQIENINTYPDPTIIRDHATEVFDHAADGVLDATEATVAEVPLVFDRPGDGVTPIPQIHDDAPALTDRSIQPLLTQFSAQHEIIRNQRLISLMPGARVHGRPSSGYWLETYPDGMQIEHLKGGERRLVRDSDYDSSTAHYGTTSSSHSSYKRIAMFAPLSIIVLVLLAGFVAAMVARRRRRNGDEAPRSGWGATLSGIAMIFLLVMGTMFFGYQRVSHRSVIEGIETPVSNLFDAQQAAREQVARAKAHAAAAQQLADSVNQQAAAQHDAAAQLAAVIDNAPIEQLLSHMTAPRIMLTPPRSVAPKSSAHQELVDAAQKILAATIPGADPFTQGWLVNAAKTIVAPAAQRAAEANAQATAAAAKGKTQAKAMDAKKAAVAVAMQAVQTPKPKPDWLVNPLKFSGEVRRYVVSVGPYVTMAECEQALAREMREIVQTRFRDAVASESGLPEGEWAYNPDIGGVGISDAQILREFCADEYVEKVDASVGEMLKAHALLEFGPQEDALLVDHFKRWMRHGRLEDVVNVSALAVFGLAFVFGLLKVDTWTRGYYTKRLFLGVPAFIIVVGGIALFWAMQ